MDSHGTETVSPVFTLEVVGAYSDPLRRQLMEALFIVDQGTLNGKNEFGVIEIYTLQCTVTRGET